MQEAQYFLFIISVWKLDVNPRRDDDASKMSPYGCMCSASLQILLYISYDTTITLILFSAIIAFLVVVLLHLTVSRKSQNNLELAAKN